MPALTTAFVFALASYVAVCRPSHQDRRPSSRRAHLGRQRHRPPVNYAKSDSGQRDLATLFYEAHASNDNSAWCHVMDEALHAYAESHDDDVWTAILHVVQDKDTHNATNAVTAWMQHKCNATMWRRYVEVAPYPTCDPASKSLLNTPSCAGFRTCTRQHSKGLATTPHVAIMLGVTSKKVDSPSTSNTALFTLALPSIAKTVECGFKYTVFVGYDVGDAFYDSPDGSANLTAWFDQHVGHPLQHRGIDIRLNPVRVDNSASKPGPVFNEVARHAHAAGADFFYRINDDTLMLTPWTAAFACALCSLGPPYGVVGPVESIMPDFLTHDFVHRTHLAVFDDYYPAELSDWWMDNWISQVYGSARSLRLASVKTLHLVNTHGSRYEVDKAHETLLQPLLQQGRHRIRDYVSTHLPALASEYSDEFARSEFEDVIAIGRRR